MRPVQHLAGLLLDIVIRTERVSTLLSRPAALDRVWNAAYDILAKIDAVGIVPSETAEPREVRDWKVENGDVRADPAIAQEILDFIEGHSVLSVRHDGRHHRLPTPGRS
jgi:hypothetical protein